MKLIKKFAGALVAIVLMVTSKYEAMAATYTWDGGGSDLLWSTVDNWDTATAPTTGDTAVIGDTATDRTIIYTNSASGTLGTLSMSQSTAGVSNVLKISGGVTTFTGTDDKKVYYYTLSVASNILLGSDGGNLTAVSKILLDASLNQTAASGYNVRLIVNSGSGTINLKSGGELALQGYVFDTNGSTTAGGYAGWTSTVSGSVELNGGKLTNVTQVNPGNIQYGAIANSITGTLKLVTGEIELQGGSAAYNKENRLSVGGNFTMEGGELNFGSGAVGEDVSMAQLVLNGTTNVISGGTVSGNGVISLGGGSQSFSTNQYHYYLLSRAWGNNTKTISNSSSATLKFNSFEIGQGTANATTTLKFGSNITVKTLFAGYGIGTSSSAASVGYALDLNGKNLTMTDGTTNQSWTPNNANSYTAGYWYITNTGATTSTFEAESFNFSSATKVHVGYNPSTVATTVGTASTSSVILKATGTGANNLGSGSFNPTSKFWYTGTSSTITTPSTIGKLEIGSGSSSTLKIITTALTTAGTVKVNSSGIFDLGGYQLTVGTASNTAYLAGNGTIKSTSSGASVVFVGAGGLSPGGAVGSDENGIGPVGTLTFDSSTKNNFTSTGVQLASTSTSYFDIASVASYDQVNLGGIAITYAGTLSISVTGSYTVGQTWELFLNEGAVTGDFASITSSNASYVFDFNEATGVLTLVAIPEPSTILLFMVSSMVLICGIYFRRHQVQPE